MEYVLFQMKIPKHVSDKLRAKLVEIQAAHAEDVKANATATAVKTDSKISSLRDEREALKFRGRCLSIHNLIRVALVNGLPAIESPKNALALLAKYGIPTGRPREPR